MKRSGPVWPTALTVAVALLLPPLVTAADVNNWQQFRGPAAAGKIDGADPPTTWNVESGENVRWRTPIPGLGHSSPAVWGDRVFVTTAVRSEGEDELKVGLYGDIAPVQNDPAHEWIVKA